LFFFFVFYSLSYQILDKIIILFGFFFFDVWFKKK
jgi:hypothetical protein